MDLESPSMSLSFDSILRGAGGMGDGDIASFFPSSNPTSVLGSMPSSGPVASAGGAMGLGLAGGELDGWSRAVGAATTGSGSASASSTPSLVGDVDSETATSASSSSGSACGRKRQVELDVHLTRDPTDPSRVKVRLIDPLDGSEVTDSASLLSTPSMPLLALGNTKISTPPSTDFLGMGATPSSPLSGNVLSLPGYGSESGYAAYVSGQERKRVRICVGGDGEWEIEVK